MYIHIFAFIFRRAFGAIDLAERSNPCRFVGTLHVAFPGSRGRWPSLIRRNRLYIYMYMYIYIYIYKCILSHTYIQICTYAYICACI